ncbi:hypothetical protein H4Q26_009419 [Puccinia striiformis f. sp. tritici PST-130]|nr:hypothetical protein H4Q26_009419 [Puccinia striiformis f. sp. tritici PST-130]
MSTPHKSTTDPNMNYDKVVSRSTNPDPPPEWMRPQYDPIISKAADLRFLMLKYDIPHLGSSKKAELVMLFNNKLKPKIPELLKAHCSVVGLCAGIFDVALGGHLTAEDNDCYLAAQDSVKPCNKPDVGPEPVPKHHPSLEGKTVAQIKQMMLNLDPPTLVTAKLNAADAKSCRILTAGGSVEPCKGPNQDEAVTVYHHSFKGKTVAQIKQMMFNLNPPVLVPSKTLLKPLKTLATAKLNAADAKSHRIEIQAQHHLDSDSNSDLTELSSSKSEDENHHPTNVSPNRPTGGRCVKSPFKTPLQTLIDTGTLKHPTSTPKYRPIKTHLGTVKTPSQTLIDTGTHPGAVKNPLQTLNDTSTSNHPGSVETPNAVPHQIPAAALRPEAWVSSDGASPLANPPLRIPSVAAIPILDSPSEQCVPEILNPVSPRAWPIKVSRPPPLPNSIIPPLIDFLSSSSANPAPPIATPNVLESETMRLLSGIDLSKPLPDKGSKTSDLIFLDEPLEAYNFPISVPVLPFTKLASQHQKEKQPQPCTNVIAGKAPDQQYFTQAPCTSFNSDEAPNEHSCPPINKHITKDNGFAPMNIDDAQINDSQSHDKDTTKLHPSDNILRLKSPAPIARDTQSHAQDTTTLHPSDNIFQCLIEDIEQVKMRLKYPLPISGKVHTATSAPATFPQLAATQIVPYSPVPESNPPLDPTTNNASTFPQIISDSPVPPLNSTTNDSASAATQIVSDFSILESMAKLNATTNNASAATQISSESRVLESNPPLNCRTDNSSAATQIGSDLPVLKSNRPHNSMTNNASAATQISSQLPVLESNHPLNLTTGNGNATTQIMPDLPVLQSNSPPNSRTNETTAATQSLALTVIPKYRFQIHGWCLPSGKYDPFK